MRSNRAGILAIVILAPCAATPATAQQPALADADARFQARAFGEAAILYKSVLEKEPTNQAAEAGLVRSLLKDNQVDEAYTEGLKAAKAFDVALFWSLLGDVTFRQANFVVAERLYRGALARDPKNARALFGLSALARSDFQRKSAAKYLKDAFEADPNDPEILIDYAATRPYAERMELYKKYLSRPDTDEDIAESTHHMAEFYDKFGDRHTWVLQGDPKPSQIKLGMVSDDPRRPYGFRMAAVINGGKPVQLQLDTGASGLLLHRKAAERVGLEILGAQTVRGIGEKGKQSGQRGMAQSVRIGEVEFHDCPITVSESKSAIEEVDGLIGVNVFDRFLIALDLAQRRIDLNPLPPIDGKPYDDPSAWSQLDRNSIPSLPNLTPMRRRGHLLIEVTGNNKAHGYFILDTGSAAHIASVRFLRDAGKMGKSSTVVRGLSGAVKDVYSSSGPVSLIFGHFRQQIPELLGVDLSSASKAEGVEVSGLLGYPALGLLRITIDYRDGLIGFEYPAEKK